MKKVITAVVVIIVTIGIFKAMSGVTDKVATNQMQKIENKVALDAVAQYEIAKRQGDKMQIWAQAQFVSAAYLQAKDEANYQKWKAIEKEAAKEAGMPE